MTAALETEAVAARAPAVARAEQLDRIRGLAIAFMVVDHLTLICHGPFALRIVPGRLALPLFFVLAGHLLAHRPRWRWLGIGAAGLVLPVAVPWIDDPNVLVWYALGALLLCWWRPGVHVWLVVSVLTLMANTRGVQAQGYDPWALWGLMALGRVLPREVFSWGTKLPGWLKWPGRWPLSVYVGHLLVLELVRGLLWNS